MQDRKPFFSNSLLAGVAFSLLLTGCDSGTSVTTPTGTTIVTLSVEGLQPLRGGFNYQAWLVSENASGFFGNPIVLFNIDDTGRMVDPAADTLLTGPFMVDGAVSEVAGVAISLEATSVLVEFSSFTFILSGEKDGENANLTATDWFALDRDFSTASGKFVLSTLTDDDPANELHGIWFLDPGQEPWEPGLNLPEAPTGWIYEGWVEVAGKQISTGRFVSPLEADSTGFFSSGIEPPIFPGEDFLFNAPQGFTFPLDLAGATVFISIEPWEGMDAYPEDPFFLRVLEGQVPATPSPLTLYSLPSMVDQFPTGTATIRDGG